MTDQYKALETEDTLMKIYTDRPIRAGDRIAYEQPAVHEIARIQRGLDCKKRKDAREDEARMFRDARIFLRG
jgi:hypothetical protein